MKVTLQETPEQFAMIQAMASKDRETAIEAQEAFASLVGPVLCEVMNQAPTISNFYTRQAYDMGTVPMLPVDTYFDVTDQNFLYVWSQTAAGGLGTNEPIPTVGEMPVKTYRLDSAHSFDRKYAANPRMGLNIVAKTMTRLMQEILIKQENFSMGPLASALANASVAGRKNVQRVNSAGRLLPADFNELITLAARMNQSWYGGTPIGGSLSVSDLIMSPEAMESLREMSYNPINTKTAPQASAIKDSVAAPESVRSRMFEAGDIATFYGKTLHTFLEFGVGRRFNNIFDAAAGSTQYARPDGTTGAAAFDGAADQIIVGINRSRDPLLRLAAVDGEGSEFSVMSDDQFYSRRASKIGFFGGLEEGRLVPDSRGLIGLVL